MTLLAVDVGSTNIRARLLVVAEKVDMDDRRDPRHVDFCTDRGELPQQHRDDHTCRDERQLLEYVQSFDESTPAIHDRQQQLQYQKHAGT